MPVSIPLMSTPLIPVGNDTDEGIVEGDSFEHEFEHLQEDGSAVDFTSYAGTCQIRNDVGDLMASPTVSGLDAAGIVTLTLTALPAAGTYDYDIQIISGAIKKTIQRGPWMILPQVTVVI